MALPKTSIIAKCGRSLCRQILWQFRTREELNHNKLEGRQVLRFAQKNLILSTDRFLTTKRAFLPNDASTRPVDYFLVALSSSLNWIVLPPARRDLPLCQISLKGIFAALPRLAYFPHEQCSSY